jgi:hypothetical protein
MHASLLALSLASPEVKRASLFWEMSSDPMAFAQQVLGVDVASSQEGFFRYVLDRGPGADGIPVVSIPSKHAMDVTRFGVPFEFSSCEVHFRR